MFLKGTHLQDNKKFALGREVLLKNRGIFSVHRSFIHEDLNCQNLIDFIYETFQFLVEQKSSFFHFVGLCTTRVLMLSAHHGLHKHLTELLHCAQKTRLFKKEMILGGLEGRGAKDNAHYLDEIHHYEILH